MNRNLRISAFNTLPVVQFTNNSTTPPTRCVWVCENLVAADEAQEHLVAMAHISDVSVDDAPIRRQQVWGPR